MIARPLSVKVPGDKSIAHRTLMIAALAPGESVIVGLPEAADVRSTATALAELGVMIEWPAGSGRAVVTPPAAWPDRTVTLDCGNSGTSARLLTGLVAGLGLSARIDGDTSLRSRPMDRVVYPLQAMGARITYAGASDRLPVELEARASGNLRVLRYRSRVSSAQVKSALVLAAIGAGIEFEMWDPGQSRDHTERLLEHLGVPLSFGPDGKGAHLRLEAGGRARLRSLDVQVPGDPSSAAFLLGAGLLRGRSVTVDGLLLNPTRTGFLDVLEQMGADIEMVIHDEWAGEPVGSVSVNPGPLHGVRIEASQIPGLVDEIPLIVVLAAIARGETRISGAGELRLKESDRLATLAENLAGIGGTVEERPDGLTIAGDPDLVPRGSIRTHGDHRIAMAFGAMSVVPGSNLDFDDPACVAVSYPKFWDACAVVGEAA
ncbi:MAG: 3-phosphoshikimate 1-carboxyvinyltransferase [Gemmatimonadota bacterium]